MKIIAEQSVNTRLRIAPKDCIELTDEEWEEFIIELRGNRGKAVKKPRAARAPKDPTNPGPKAAKPASVDDWDDISG